MTLILTVILLGAGNVSAQLDFGSPQVSKEEINLYAEPFYKLMAAPLGAGRLLPAGVTGWTLGLETMATPVPDREQFENAERSVWPAVRALAGFQLDNAALGIRGMGWRDPRMGTVFTYGTNLSGRLPVGKLVSLALQGGWDHLSFGSTYSYYSGGTILSGGEVVPGDYTLHEDSWGGTVGLVIRPALWEFFARTGPEVTRAHLRYLYYPSQRAQEVRTSKTMKGWRTEGGAGWRGFQVAVGYYFEPYATLGWSWTWKSF